MPLLFSYGTLQQDDVQRATFGRLLSGRRDALVGYTQTLVEIDDADVVALSGKTHHPMLVFTGDRADRVAGTVFEITDAELLRSDEYEVAAYRRVEAELASGGRAWVYADARDPLRSSCHIEIDHETAPMDVRAIEQGLIEHARTSGIGPRDYRPLGFLLRDDGGALVGGLIGATVWGWLQVRDLWIADHARGQGWGSKLMDCAEREGIARGCHHACLDTFDFQALEFYRRRGYEVFGTLRDFPTGHERYFVSKRLTVD